MTERGHAPLIAIGDHGLLTHIVRCTCGWVVPAHEQNSDTAFAMHVAAVLLDAAAPAAKDDQR